MTNAVTQVHTRIEPSKKIYDYDEIVAYLDGLPAYVPCGESVERFSRIDGLFQHISRAVTTILVGGAHGKSTAMYFAQKIFREECISVMLLYTTHFFTYNERMVHDTHAISQDDFVNIFNMILPVVAEHNVVVTARELLHIASLLYAKNNDIELVLIEVPYDGQYDVTALCKPCITALTCVARVTTPAITVYEDLDAKAYGLSTIAQPGSWFLSAEQSKLRLQKMKVWVEERGGKWIMPIRKLAPLPYIYEQLYGRLASLAERIVQIYVEEVKQKFSPFLRGNLLATQQGQRGRPTLEAKRQAELCPIKSMSAFWHQEFSLLHGRFEVLSDEKPMIVLDTARSVDSYLNFFLGIRLLHYKKPFKNVALILGVPADVVLVEFMKALRYLLKKIPGEVFFVPLSDSEESHDPHYLLAQAKTLNIKARAYGSFAQGFDGARLLVGEVGGVIALSGGISLAKEYMHDKSFLKKV